MGEMVFGIRIEAEYTAEMSTGMALSGGMAVEDVEVLKNDLEMLAWMLETTLAVWMSNSLVAVFLIYS